MTDADLLTFPGLSPHEQRIVDMRIREGLRANVIAKRMGMTIGAVHALIYNARQRVRGKRPVAMRSRATNTRSLVMDADWFPRNVAMYRKSEHPQNFLNGITLVWGQEWADKVERAARS